MAVEQAPKGEPGEGGHKPDVRRAVGRSQPVNAYVLDDRWREYDRR